MIKKYLPLIILLLAAFSVWFIKSHQRGSLHATITDSIIFRNKQKAIVNSDSAEDPDMIDPGASTVIYSKHARCRMECRHISEKDVREVLNNGTLNTEKVEKTSKGVGYPLEETIHGRHLRIVFARIGTDAVEVVTCIDLDTDWPCDCQ